MANQCVTSDSPTDTASPVRLPVIVAEWDRNAREIVRVALDQFNGRHTLNVRVWYRDGNDLRPSKAGLTLALKHLEPLAIALNSAIRVAHETGLIADGGEQ